MIVFTPAVKKTLSNDRLGNAGGGCESIRLFVFWGYARNYDINKHNYYKYLNYQFDPPHARKKRQKPSFPRLRPFGLLFAFLSTCKNL